MRGMEGGSESSTNAWNGITCTGTLRPPAPPTFGIQSARPCPPSLLAEPTEGAMLPLPIQLRPAVFHMILLLTCPVAFLRVRGISTITPTGKCFTSGRGGAGQGGCVSSSLQLAAYATCAPPPLPPFYY
eukprot:Sspe_Gene.107978::Locus_87112_Transcript_1_1_Confidence_1.000_Length_1149::g.107978::m.107978